MPNPLLNGVNIPGQNNVLSNLFAQYSKIQNPQQYAMNIINSNPQAKAIFNQIQQSGMSPKDFLMNNLQSKIINR
ncbi:hypothetical protein [Mammaliicoccus vitulinus]|uniref:hypothetical protein n=1 Tax=Mammaliicoccus vitulinus TaxID=71237 RepID=UPI00248B2AF9|nr:hypothetical protein [Mammaliicoccus vitulinus]